MENLNRRQWLLSALGTLAAGALSARRHASAGPVTVDQYGDQVQTLPRGQLPGFARSGGPDVERLYRFALEQGKDLDYVPCYCGCGNIGHRSNRECYVKSENRDGTVTFTSHAAS